MLNETLAAGEDINDGTLIARKFDNRVFTLPSGQRYAIDSFGERKANILAELFNYTTGEFQVIHFLQMYANYFAIKLSSYFTNINILKVEKAKKTLKIVKLQK